jgi:outer membrane beta-barrel protein
MTNSIARRIAIVASFSMIVFAPLAAHAQRKSPLEDAPAIRKRVELRETRFEIGAGLTSTITQDFYNTYMLGGRAAFHINDWLSIAAFGNFALANSGTGFNDRLVQVLPPNTPMPLPRDPMAAQATGSMQQIKAIVGGQLEFTPFTGKYSLFGKLFAHYDFYILAGGGLMDVQPTNSAVCTGAMLQTSTAGQPQSYCGVSGFKPGPQAGLGLHTFFNNWFALNVELRDFVARLNPSGRDVNGDGVANSSDSEWTSTFMVTANLMFFLPAAPAISQ